MNLLIFLPYLYFVDCEITQRLILKKFKCRVCEKKFSSKNGLNRHHKTKHDESNPIKCKICLKVFPTKHHLAVHSRVHTGEKPYVCSNCGKGFAQKIHLKRHEATHSEERKHKCDICPEGKSFKTKVGLRNHMKYHFEPEYQCNLCGKKFYTSTHLKAHENIHLR